MDGRGVNQGEVLQVIRNHFKPKLVEFDPRLGKVRYFLYMYAFDRYTSD